MPFKKWYDKIIIIIIKIKYKYKYMENNNNQIFDVLKELEIEENKIKKEKENHINTLKNIEWVEEIIEIKDEIGTIAKEINKKENSKLKKQFLNLINYEIPLDLKKIYSYFIFIIKYISTSSLIFLVLLLTTNYSAYYNIAKSYLYEDEFKSNEQSLITSVEASNILKKEEIKRKTKEEQIKKIEEKQYIDKWVYHSINKLVAKSNKNEINLDINITPYENRIIIPKIGKNIPLLDIKNKEIDWLKELNNIFLKELENWVIRYPSSAKPWEVWNTFIFWHSSNFPWIKWDYNDVFSLLDKVNFDDTIIVYYNQKEYKYKIREKKVIKPSDVSILKRKKWDKEITIMTCWPIGTTLNRLILIWDLIEKNNI